MIAPYGANNRSLHKKVTRMAHDAELDRLKAAQDQAFQRKQKAYDVMQAAWQRRSAAREIMDRAYQEKQRAYEVMDSEWQNYQQIRQHNGPRIDYLNAAQEEAYQNMRHSFDSASSSYAARDGASARYFADQGHHYKQVAQDCVVERRRLVQEIREARDRREASRPAFEYARGHFDRVKVEHDQAKAEHLRAQEEFKRAKPDFNEAVSAFRKRLGEIRRTPPVMAQIARNAWARREVTGRQIQYEDGDHKVKVTSGYSHESKSITTDVIIAPRHDHSKHYHLVLDDRGNVIFNEWRQNR